MTEKREDEGSGLKNEDNTNVVGNGFFIKPNGKSFTNYLTFWIGQLFSLMGSSITQFALTYWITVETRSTFLLSLGNFLYLMPMAVVLLIAGVFTDRWNRKLTIIVADTLQAAVTIFIIMLFQFGYTDPVVIIIINSSRGVFQAFHTPTVNAIIPTMVPKDKLSRINGINALFSGLVNIIGPMISATLVLFMPIQLVLWMDPLTYIVAMVPLLLISIPGVMNGEKEGEKRSFTRDFKVGFKTLVAVPGLLTMLLVAMIVNFMLASYFVLSPYFILIVHGGGSLVLALMQAFMNGGVIAGAFITSLKKNWSHKALVYFIGEYTITLSIAAVALTPLGFFPLIGIAMGLMGLIIPIINTIFQTVMQVTVPLDKLGRVSSIDWAVSLAISPIGGLIAGALGEIITVNFIFLTTSIIAFVAVTLFWFLSGIRKVNYDDPALLKGVNEKLNGL